MLDITRFSTNVEASIVTVVLLGIVVTVKQRQEFRIRLQKRARRAAEKKLENYVEEQNAKTVSSHNHCHDAM